MRARRIPRVAAAPLRSARAYADAGAAADEVLLGWAEAALAAADVAGGGASRRAVADGAASTAASASRLRCACVWVLCARPQRRAPAEPARGWRLCQASWHVCAR